jgi:hypothetical protein
VRHCSNQDATSQAGLEFMMVTFAPSCFDFRMTAENLARPLALQSRPAAPEGSHRRSEAAGNNLQAQDHNSVC